MCRRASCCLLLAFPLATGSPWGPSGPRLAPAPPVPQPQCFDTSPAAKLRGGSIAGTCESAALREVKEWHPVLLALLGTSFGWFMTALGAAAVIIKRLGLPEPLFRKVLDFFLGVSGGVMTAASYWSLLAPALDFAEQQGWEEGWAAMPVALGFVSGGALLQLTDLLMSNLHESLEDLSLYKNVATSEGSATRSQRLRRLLLLIIAITIHNFPEGMAVGVAFGALGSAPGATFGKAVSLAIGIGIQNFPEGMAVSMPLMREGISPLQAFWYGQLSGLVEPIGGVLGAAFVQYCKPMLPFTMSLAAGAMIFVVADSLVPEMQAHGNKAIAMQGLMLGFVFMMVLDVTLG
ncbi:hypothetical protein EMIHUDRAFT_352521 [Emiliania huxleyi CCMP1516]|uniref:Zinc transporter ZIP11 n=2 Tax=Emiliania huxleyi TaxID=2903 RepID=A0A0D3K884_EMIH1|nr:hypothetical protein EMIHUDRAFT_368520 [Emiliania huxleyi CCMP1516]XP_005778041.1 hypothetical protein EMIHUDRAFT_367273 [Emiliania huxleyi CCMP1516]XP_005784398.1 hypothetical protein EMIHUDRAFT_352521 [Emiliania huxleyi CCMP1516]EOD21988.1 hypothetical protein EMIHUDRAFT_368520 [Emiliania huxleyi CCMP1516]EOD25612.1 hypothetical protein EMIHUDRAFT_367273 [Emiliania huxleyi CCMP1516]EOD31969.1 hypothetical protein EMIHUDRAFT_352521 [Emiliania huxleyi CCMP1516]|eukprot:XP_005774417.1 hypothetical protein EMIHUDRAFT_368520 [Emiliania huxleyi CCMP1516]